jgi:hypothetical protein
MSAQEQALNEIIAITLAAKGSSEANLKEILSRIRCVAMAGMNQPQHRLYGTNSANIGINGINPPPNMREAMENVMLTSPYLLE